MPRRPLMVRAALLRRSCDGVADGAAQTSSVALILRIASRRDALNVEPASFPPGLIPISMVVAHSPRPPPWPREILMNIQGGSWGVAHSPRLQPVISFSSRPMLPSP